DAAGHPVVAYYDATAKKLKILHCGDAACLSPANTTATPDAGANVGQYASLRLDGSGFPVVAYYDATAKTLKVLHCGAAPCASGNPPPPPRPNRPPAPPA